MLIRTFFLCTILLVLVVCKKRDAVRINLSVKQTGTNVSCDHTEETIKEHKYIALEGGTINLLTNYKSLFNNLSCVDSNDASKVFINDPETTERSNLTVTVTKEMSTTWKCTVLVNKDNLSTRPHVPVGEHNYTAAYCYMQVHVRRLTSPQTILVNNMVLEQVRTDLSEQQVDYTVEYEYADSDLIHITCAAFNSVGQYLISMQYNYIENISNKMNSSKIESIYYTGFRAKFHSGYNNTQMICLLNGTNHENENAVRITFVMRSEFKRIVNLKINDMILRPKLKQNNNNYYVDYKYVTNQRVYVFCHIQRADMKLNVTVNSSLFSNNLIANDSTYSIEVSPKENSTMIRCLADYVTNRTGAEITQINLISEVGFIDSCPLHVNLPTSRIVLELHERNYRRTIYYEFDEGELLTLSCYTTCGRVIYLKFEDSAHTKNKNDSNISVTLDLSQQKDTLVKTCLMIEKSDRKGKKDTTIKRVTVYFRKAIYIPNTTLAPTTALPEVYKPQRPGTYTEENIYGGNLPLIAASAVTLIVVLSVGIIIYNMRKRNHLQRGPNDGHYENLQNQSTASIPAHPVQWESNYAVPVDQRVDNETYSVPVKPDNMYATPIPKSKRKKQQEEPTYASLDLYPSVSGRNILKDTQDYNYTEVRSKLEDCYAKVLPKNKRNVKNESHYANVANERQYANTNRAEPMYCEPNSALQSQRAEYANVNNGFNANGSAQDYVEPTYCEPHIRK